MFVARDERTWASALFVSLSAVGMALGPLLALPLARAPSTKLLGDRPSPSCGYMQVHAMSTWPDHAYRLCCEGSAWHLLMSMRQLQQLM